MDSDSFNTNDHGMYMDPDSASHDNSSTLFGTTSSNHADPGMHTGPSTSSQPSSTSRSHLRCVNCGLNVTKIRRHLLKIVEVRNLIQQWVRQQQVQVSSDSLVCHSCWTAAWNQTRHLSGAQQKSNVFSPGCIETNRHTVPSALCVHLFCEYNYYVPPECRICYYYLTSNYWDLLLKSIYNPIKTFSGAQMEDFASLLKDNMHKHLDFENIQYMGEHYVYYYLGC